MVNDQHGPEIDRQAAEAAVELVTDGDGVLRVLSDLEIDGQQRQLGDPVAALGSRRPVARPDEDPVQPGVEAIRIAERPDVEPRGDERVLDRILGPIVIADDEPGHAEEALDRARSKLREGVVIAFPGPDDEVSLHAAR